MKVRLQETSLCALKRHLRNALPNATATERVEALARGLGFKTYASLRALIAATGAISKEFDEPAFVSYLAARGTDAPARTLQRVVIRALLDVILAENSILTMHGFGAPRDRTWVTDYGAVVEQSRQEFYEDRSCDQFELALLFLQRAERRKTLNRELSSYRLKHVAENIARDFKVRTDLRNYVSNGAFIAAALYEGFEVKRVARASLNGYLNISAKSVHAFESESFVKSALLVREEAA